MEAKNHYKRFENLLDNQVVLKYFKIAGIAAGVVFGLYALGHFLKISAHTINGFNELKSAISNGNK